MRKTLVGARVRTENQLTPEYCRWFANYKKDIDRNKDRYDQSRHSFIHIYRKQRRRSINQSGVMRFFIMKIKAQ